MGISGVGQVVEYGLRSWRIRDGTMVVGKVASVMVLCYGAVSLGKD